MNNVSRQINYTNPRGETFAAIYCIHPVSGVWAAWIRCPDGSIYDTDSFAEAMEMAYYATKVAPNSEIERDLGPADRQGSVT